jgi:hypothetical protein
VEFRNTPRTLSSVLILVCLLLFGPSASGAAESFRVGIVPFELHASQDIGYLVQGIKDMLSSRLASPETQLIEPTEVSAATQGLTGTLSPTAAAGVMEKLQADFLIYGSVTKLGDKYSLNWKISSAASPEKPTGLARTATEDELIPIIDEMAGLAREVISGKPPTILVARPQGGETEVQEPPKPEAPPEEPPADQDKGAIFERQDKEGDESAGAGAVFKPQKGSTKLFIPVNISPRPLSMATGDLTGNGVDEVILISEKQLQIYAFRGDIPGQVASIKKPLPGRLLMVSTGDIDNDGRDEIALTSLYGSLPRAAVFKLDGKRLQRLAKLSNRHLKIIPSPQGPILVAQEATLSDLFIGPFVQYSLAGGKLVGVGGIPGSNDIEFSTLARGDLTGDGQAESIGLSLTEKLSVVNATGQVIYRSGNTFGGTNNVISLPDKNPNNEDIVHPLNAQVVVADVDGDKKPETLVVHNMDTARRISVNLSHYRKGSIFVMTWNGRSLTPKWRTPQLEEYVAAVGVVKLADKSKRLVLAGSEPEFYGGTFKLWKKTKGYLFRAPLTFEEKQD